MSKIQYIQAWKNSNAILQWNNAIENRENGLRGLSTFQLPNSNLNNVPFTLAYKMGLKQGSKTSWYELFIPPTNNEVIKIRMSDHKSTETEWPPIEDCLPNRRYSIVIFSEESMNIQKNAHIKYIDWYQYNVEGIPVYEICIYCGFLTKVWSFLYKVISTLYNGGHPEQLSINDYLHSISDDKRETPNDMISQWNRTVDKINDSKTNKYMKKNVVKINENTLRQIVAESVKKVLNEVYGGYFNPNERTPTKKHTSKGCAF